MVSEGARVLGIAAKGGEDPRALLAELFRRLARYKMQQA